MNILGIRDEVTGKPVRYRIVRNDAAEQRVGEAMKRVMQEHKLAGDTVKNLYQGWQESNKPALLAADMPSLERKGVGTAKVKFPDSVFDITYTAGKTPAMDWVKWVREGVAPPMVDGPYGGKKDRPVKFAGNLHESIRQANEFYPGESELLRKAIMGLNPEYRSRTGVVSLRKIEDLGPVPRPTHARLNGRRDLAWESELRPYIGSRVEIVKTCKSGLIQIRTSDGGLYSVPKRNLDLVDGLYTGAKRGTGLAGPKGMLPA
jgi:hypothetical protein